MEKISIKKVLICLSIIFFLVWGLLIYAVDPIKINPLRFISTMRIQQIHLYYRLTKSDNGLEKDDIVKAWLKNEWGNDMWVLYIRPVDVTDSFVDETNNSIAHPDEASIIWGQENTNLWYESTMILWWSRNTADWQWVTLMWGDNDTALVDNAVVLWSNNATVWAPNWVIIASEGWTVNWKNSTLLGWWGTITANAENSFWVVMSNQLEQKWVFAVWRVNVLKPNIVALNFWKWLIVKWTKPNSNSKVQLTVNGALAVGYWKCSDNMVWAVYYVPAETKDEKPAYCLCSCVLSWYNKRGDKIIAPMALSNQPYCDGICNWWWWSEPECWTRWLKDSHLVYENWETDWRVASNYCRDNTMPISYTGSDKKGNIRTCSATLDESCIENPNLPWCTCDPSFLSTGETLEWTCKGIWLYDRVKCGAYRKAAAPDNAVCWENANKYVLNANWFLNPWADGFCHWWDTAHPENRSENAVPIAIKVLSKEDIENWVTWTYVTYDIKDYETVLNELNYYFIKKWWRTFWKCATTNADNETITWAEVVSDQECYAERMPCNYCGASGFPYCFDVDFGSWCEEGAWSSCIPWSDNNWPYQPLYDSWDSTWHVDSLFAITGLTEFSYTDSRIKGVTFKEVSTEPWHWYASYKFDANTTNSIRTWVVHFKTKDKSFCPEWDTYLIQCWSWYVLEDWWHECIKIDCKWETPKNAVPANDIKVDNISTKKFLATWDDLNKACAYKCKEGYTYLLSWWVEPFCARCSDDWVVNVEHWYCDFLDEEFCISPYEWFDDLEKYKCALPGTCKGYQTWEAVHKDFRYKDIMPVANKYGQETSARCVDGTEWISDSDKHQCLYTCNEDKWYVCTAEGTCEKPTCLWNTSTDWTQWNILKTYIDWGALYWSAFNNENYIYRWTDINTYKKYAGFRETERYLDLNTSLRNWDKATSYWFDIGKASQWGSVKTVQNPTIYWEYRFYVEAPSEAKFKEKVRNLNWCFYWCTWDDFRMKLVDENNSTYVSYECWEKPVSPGCSWWWDDTPSSLVYLCSGSRSIVWPYETSFVWWDTGTYKAYSIDWKYDKNSNRPCSYRCKDWYNKTKDSNGNYTCWKKCEDWEYVRDLECLSCPDWYLPTTWAEEKDSHWNSLWCWKKCKNSERVGSDGLCYSCGAWRMWSTDPKHKDKRWNSTQCQDICSWDEIFWTAIDLSDCNWDETCCLPKYQNWTTRCDNPEYKDVCEKVNGKCICHTNVEF